jgi:sulfane dehydrogenase subunit SoxC
MSRTSREGGHAMEDPEDGKFFSERRRFLTGVAGLAGAAATALADRALAANPKNLPPNVPDWSRALGDGVAVRPYGKPSRFEKHVVRRDVQ